MNFLSIAVLVLDVPRTDWDFVKLFVRVCVEIDTTLMPGAVSVPQLTQVLGSASTRWRPS